MTDGPRIAAVRRVHGALGGFAGGTRRLSLNDPRFMLAALIDRRHPPSGGRARGQVRCAQQALTERTTIRTRGRLTHLGHRPRQFEGTVIRTLEFVDWHCSVTSRGEMKTRLKPAQTETPVCAGKVFDAPVVQVATAKSEPAGTELADGPSAEGVMSKLKISVGIAKVAQALGISTIPLIRPSTGAVPRMAYAWAPV